MEPDHTSTTGRLRVLAPAAAEWPSWWRRNLTPGALYIIGSVTLTAVVVVTTFIVSTRHDRGDMDKLTKIAESIVASQSDMSGDLKLIKSDVADLKEWKHDMTSEALKRNPYVKPAHGKPAK